MKNPNRQAPEPSGKPFDYSPDGGIERLPDGRIKVRFVSWAGIEDGKKLTFKFRNFVLPAGSEVEEAGWKFSTNDLPPGWKADAKH